jgi:nitrile hydratase
MSKKYKNPMAAGHHDLGGSQDFDNAKVNLDDESIDLEGFGARVDALRLVLGAKKIMSVDELRRGVEAIPREEYFQTQYYERWLRSMIYILLEKGLIEAKDIA